MYPLGARHFICPIITAYSPVYLKNRLWCCNTHIPHWRNWSLVVPWTKGSEFWSPVLSSLTSLEVMGAVCVLGHIWFFVTPWTLALQASLSMEFFQARMLEWFAISDSRGSSQLRDWAHVSGKFFTTAPPGKCQVAYQIIRFLSG